MPLALILAWLPLWYVVTAQTRLQMVDADLGSSDLRRSGYFRTTAMSPSAAKEIRLYGLGGWLLEKFDHYHHLGAREMWRDRGFTR